MYYSLTFGNEKNTWADWGLIPNSPPMISVPEPNINQVDIPGRVKGPLDLSKLPFGKITYQRVKGSWSFFADIEGRTARLALYDRICKFLHGRETTLILEDDPLHYYKGRFTVGGYNSTVGPMGLSIGYDLEPVRYNMDGTIDSNYILDWSDSNV